MPLYLPLSQSPCSEPVWTCLIGNSHSDLGTWGGQFSHIQYPAFPFCHNTFSQPESQVWFVPLSSDQSATSTLTQWLTVSQNHPIALWSLEKQRSRVGGIYSIHIAWGGRALVKISASPGSSSPDLLCSSLYSLCSSYQSIHICSEGWDFAGVFTISDNSAHFQHTVYF